MIRINFVPPTDPEWTQWCQDAAKEHSVLLQLYAKDQPITIKPALYKRSRQFSEEMWSKCAYCEAVIILDQTGDVEHFRPKGGITDENDKVVEIATTAGKRKHPGYFWLAYHWKNLLPSCARCNRLRRTKGGKLVGKSTRFPVFGQHATPPCMPLSVECEEPDSPKLINPLVDDPSDHLDMDEKTGILFHKSPRGEMCISIFELNRERLPETRRAVYDEILLRADAYHKALLQKLSDDAQFQKQLLLLHRTGRAAYSLAGRKALAAYQEALRIQTGIFG